MTTDPEFRDHTGQEDSGTRHGGEIREPAASPVRPQDEGGRRPDPELYLHGLSEGGFDLALRGLLGEEAPISASMVARLKERWNAELAEWRARPLDDLSAAYTVHGLPTFGRWALQIKPQRGFAARLLLSQSAEQIFLRWVRRSS